jgi:hypothetical protein
MSPIQMGLDMDPVCTVLHMSPQQPLHQRCGVSDVEALAWSVSDPQDNALALNPGLGSTM